MDDETKSVEVRQEKIIKEVIFLERKFFFEKRNVKTERQRRIKDIIERHTSPSEVDYDS